MPGNEIVEMFGQHEGFTQEAALKALREVIGETSFQVEKEGGDRRIYAPHQKWRYSWEGRYQDRPALLYIENLELQVPEEDNCDSFRQQAGGSAVRPPLIYARGTFDKHAGYGWSILESPREYPRLWKPDADPRQAAAAFADFYPEYRQAVFQPFWEKPSELTSVSLTKDRLEKWTKKSQENYPSQRARFEDLLQRLSDRLLRDVSDLPLSFQHAHLTGDGIWVTPVGQYMVGQNFLWNWRVDGYDITFPLWHQWLSLPTERLSAARVAEITDTWMEMVRTRLVEVVDARAVETMLGERFIGSLLLDIPAKIHTRSTRDVEALEQACAVEAERWLKGRN